MVRTEYTQHTRRKTLDWIIVQQLSTLKVGW